MDYPSNANDNRAVPLGRPSDREVDPRNTSAQMPACSCKSVGTTQTLKASNEALRKQK
jgi:hypothetical protein